MAKQPGPNFEARKAKAGQPQVKGEAPLCLACARHPARPSWSGCCCLRCMHRVEEEGGLPSPDDPSPAEIARACAAIRATWTDEERTARMRCDHRPVGWRCPGTETLPEGRRADVDALLRWAANQPLPA